MPVYFIDALDPRIVLASFASVNTNGTLSIVGGAAGDRLFAERSGLFIVATLNNQTQRFAASAVKRLWANGFGGGDRIENKTNLPSTLLGWSGNDTLVGGSGDDVLDGGEGKDRLIDPAGGAYFNGGSGADTILPAGGDHTGDVDTADTIDYANAPAGLVVFRGNEVRVTTSIAGASGDFQLAYNGFGSLLTLYATQGNDDVRAASYYTPFQVHGGKGNDRVEAFSQSFEGIVEAHGDDGNDTITFYGEDIITRGVFGGSGNDVFLNESSGGVPDNIDGGPGYDRYELNFRATIYGARLEVPPGVEEFGAFLGLQDGEQTSLSIVGNDLSNKIYGDANRFFILGGGGNDTLIAGVGDTYLEGNSGNDSLIGGLGDDRIFGGSGNDTLIGGAGRDLLHGQAGNDRLLSRDGERDTLDGGAGFDRATTDGALDLVTSVELTI